MIYTDINLDELRQIQTELAAQVQLTPYDISQLHTIAACDSSIVQRTHIFSVFVVYKFPSLEIAEISTNLQELTMPYISGMLAFREVPNLLQAFAKLGAKPQVIMVDGQGIAHPRGLGLASHLGVRLHLPTVGVAKSRLIGDYEKFASDELGSRNLYWQEKQIGHVMRHSLR